MGSYWYNTESGQMAANSGIGGFLQTIGGHLGLSAGWHELSGNYSSCQDAAAAAAKAYPSGASPSCSGVTVAKVVSGAASDAKNAVTGGSSSSSGGTCLWTLPVVGCVMTKTEARALIAGLIIGGSGVVALLGLILLTADGFRQTGVGHAAGTAAETAGAALAFVPGAEGAGLAIGAAGAAAKRTSSSSGASQSLQRRRTARVQRSTQAPAGPSRPGQKLTPAEVKQANQNRKKLNPGATP